MAAIDDGGATSSVVPATASSASRTPSLWRRGNCCDRFAKRLFTAHRTAGAALHCTPRQRCRTSLGKAAASATLAMHAHQGQRQRAPCCRDCKNSGLVRMLGKPNMQFSINVVSMPARPLPNRMPLSLLFNSRKQHAPPIK